jgi:polysaccharide chain length determinant protein (PEP-CTERM system associated)
VVQQVANILASLYLEENLKVREQQTAGATKFIDEEMKRVQADLADLDGKMAAFKSQNPNTLPELVQLNLQALDRVDRDIDQSKDQLRTLKEKEEYLRTQLASMPMDTSNPDKDLLKESRAKLVSLQARYSDEYPDVIKTKAEIAELEKRLAATAKKGSSGSQPDNPAYITLASQLSSTQSDIESVKRQLVDLTKKKEDFQRRITASPRVEEHYKALLMERNNTQAKYDDLMRKKMEARVAYGLEKEQMGERFTLIDAARLPEMPVRPNIPAILLIGLVLGIGVGVGMAVLKETSDQSVHTTDALMAATSATVLAGIPEIVISEDIIRVKRQRIIWLVIITVVVLVGLVAFHFLVMDLNVLWARMLRRLAI